MAQPTITATADQPSYLPGDPVTIAWSVQDADNSSETLRLTGTDSQGNTVTMTVEIAREDRFTMDSVVWERTGEELTIDNDARTATGPMISAP